MHPACPNKKQNHLQNSLLRRTQFWVRKSFSKPASLKRASLVALPVAISHKASLKPKRYASATLIQKNFQKMNLNTVGPHAQLSKRTKEKHFHGPIFGTVWRTKNETAKSQNQHQRPFFSSVAADLALRLGPDNERSGRQGNQQQRPTRATNKK